MAKEHGLGNALYISGVDVSGEARNWDVTSPVQMLDVTSLRNVANARITGQKACAFKWTSHFDPLSAGFLALEQLPRTDAVITLPHRETIGQTALCTVIKQIGYDPTRDDKGQVTFAVEGESNASFADWATMATAGIRTDTTATNGAGVDHGLVPPGSYGLQAYLQVFAFTGTDCTIKLQGSSDDAVGDPYADITGGAFTVVTSAPQGQVITTSRTQAVERWFRVVTSGTFTSIQFAVAVTVNDAAVAL